MSRQVINECIFLVLTRFTNNVLSTAQQIWLRKLGGAKPAAKVDAGGIITAGRAKREGSQPERNGERLVGHEHKNFFMLIL